MKSPRAVTVVTAALFCLSAAGMVIFPLLAELQRRYALPTYGLGLMSGIYFAGALLGQGLVSGLGDGRWARPLLVAAFVAGTASRSGLRPQPVYGSSRSPGPSEVSRSVSSFLRPADWSRS
jgi:predicted MFS family arabinose efflux permease